jgi:hypothetical protein
MDLITKDFPVLAGEASDEFPHGSFEVILSAPTLDRDGEIIDSRAFDPLPKRINFDTDHVDDVRLGCGFGCAVLRRRGEPAGQGRFRAG